MTYSATDRQQAAMTVAIRKFYRYFAVCTNVPIHTSIYSNRINLKPL